MSTYETDYDIREATESVNIADDLPEDFLEELGDKLVDSVR